MKILLLAAHCAWLLILTGILYLCVQCAESQTLIAFVRRDPHVCSTQQGKSNRRDKMRKGAKLEMQPEERHWEGANRRGRFQRKKGKYETGTKKSVQKMCLV